MKFYNVCPEGTRCNYTGVDHIPDLLQDACPLGYWCAKERFKYERTFPYQFLNKQFLILKFKIFNDF